MVLLLHFGLPGWLSGKESTCSAGDAGDLGSILESGRVGNCNPLQYSCLGNPMIEEPGGLQSMGSPSFAESDRTEQLTHYTTHSLCTTDSLFCTPKTNTTLSINYIPIKVFLKSSRENNKMMHQGKLQVSQRKKTSTPVLFVFPISD